MQDIRPVKWLRLRQVAERLGVSTETVRLLVVSGEIAARRPTGNPRGMYQVAETECTRYEAEMTGSAAATADPSLTPSAA